jgi:hypothetical protein
MAARAITFNRLQITVDGRNTRASWISLRSEKPAREHAIRRDKALSTH